jgi:cytidylate kinase
MNKTGWSPRKDHMALRYYPLIDRFFKLFQVQDSLVTPYPGMNEEKFTRPFVTIAREPGSGGVPIAQAVAKKLNFLCLDEQVIDEIANSTKLRKDLIKAVDEKNRTHVEDIVQSLLNSDYVDDLKYVTELTKVLVTYAIRGKVVIVGRGANFLTPFAKGLHVNISAPYEVRVKRAMDYEGFSRKKAEEVIAKVEKERKEFVKQYFKKDPTKINSYDLTLNTTYFSVEQARDLIIDALWRKFPGHQSKLGFLKR